MKQFVWSNLIVGENSLKEFLLSNSFNRTAFVISRMVFDALELDAQILQSVFSDRDYEIILEIEQETNVEEVQQAVTRIQSYQPDCILAVGGGSVIDAAKLLWLFYELPHYSWKDSYRFYEVEKFPGKAKLIAAPTTAGTGSEMTSAAMFVDNENKKRMFLDNQLIPTYAILDFNLIKTLPKRPMTFSAVDALTHALEGATSTTTDLVTQFISAQSIVSIFRFLPRAINNNDDNAKSNLLVASLFAGLSINNSNVGIAHSINYPGEDFNLAHGLITGMITPYALIYSKPHSFYELVLTQLGYEARTDNHIQLSEVIFELYKNIKMPTSLKELNIDEEEYFNRIPVYVKRFFTEDNEYSVAYQELDPEKLRELFEKLYEGV